MALAHSIGELADTLLSTIRTRLELFSLEAVDQKARLLRLLALLCTGLFFVGLAVLLLSATIALYFWPTPYRYLALWLMVLLYLILGGVCFWMIRRSLHDEGLPFSATLDELRRDMALVGRLRDDTRRTPADDPDRRGTP